MTIKSTKVNLKPGEVIVLCDLAENYNSFVLQDAVQSYYWTKNQATVHPFVAYYRNSENLLGHVSFVIISEILLNNTVAVHLFIKRFLNFLRNRLQKVVYFTNGAASQYKNRKNFINLTHHREHFSCDAEWHFFATSHGKGPCDGIGGVLKRLAACASLQRPYDNQIVNTRDLYNWATANCEDIHVKFCCKEDYVAEEAILQPRFDKTVTVRGTQKLHAVIPLADHLVRTRIFSLSEEFSEHTI